MRCPIHFRWLAPPGRDVETLASILSFFAFFANPARPPPLHTSSIYTLHPHLLSLGPMILPCFYEQAVDLSHMLRLFVAKPCRRLRLLS